MSSIYLPPAGSISANLEWYKGLFSPEVEPGRAITHRVVPSTILVVGQMIPVHPLMKRREQRAGETGRVEEGS